MTLNGFLHIYSVWDSYIMKHIFLRWHSEYISLVSKSLNFDLDLSKKVAWVFKLLFMMFEMQFNSQTECHRINANNKMSVNSSKIPRSFIFTLQLPKKCNSQKQYVLMLVTLKTVNFEPTSMWAFLECVPMIL